MVCLLGSKYFTFKREEKVEKYLGNILEKIIDIIVSEIVPQAIVLSGSLGRGEGTAYLKGEEVLIDSDFEIGCVCKNYLSRIKVFKVEKKLKEMIKEGITLNFFLPKRFTANSSFNFSAPQMMLTTLDQFDLLYGSRIIYGKDYLSNVSNLEKKTIFSWEGVRLIFNRMAELIEAITAYGEDLKSERKLFKSLNKFLIAIGDYFLIKDSEYSCSYFERLKKLETTDVAGIGVLKNNILSAYRMKLGIEDYDPLYAEELFSLIRSSADIYKYILEEELEMKFTDWIDFRKEYLKLNDLSFKARYFKGKPFMQNLFTFARNKFRPFHKAISLFSLKVPMFHKSYANLPEWLFHDLLSVQRIGDLPIKLKEKGIRVSSEWRYWGRYL